MSGAGSSAEGHELTHEEARALLDALREGELDPPEAARVEAHVAACERCRAVESALGGGLKALLAAPDERRAVDTNDGSAAAGGDATPDLLAGVQRKIRLRSRGRYYGDGVGRARAAAPSPWPTLIGSLALLLALAIAYVLLGSVGATSSGVRPSPSSTPP